MAAAMFTHARRSQIFAALLLLAGGGLWAQSRPAPNPQLTTHAVQTRVESLLKQMTLEEKLGQITQFSGGFATGPDIAAVKGSFDELAARGELGSLLNIVGAEQANHYQHIAVEKSRLHIPILFGLDVIHGHRTTFPVPLAVTASFDPELARQVARTSAVEARADGVAWVFSPMVDIARDPRWGRIIESSSGEDPYLGSVMARAWVRGYQQGDLKKPDSVAVSVKHFAAYGGATAGRDYYSVDLGERMLREVYLAPYKAAVEEGAATLMSSFNTIDGVPASANPWTLTQVLRKEWGFDGFVVSDWGSVAELENHFAADGPTVARRALSAGVDMDMEGGLYLTTLAAQVRSGKLPEPVVDEAVRRILRVKIALGLFENPYTPVTPAWQPTPERRQQARKTAAETLVLLKNEPVEGLGLLLPLTEKAKKVALIGPLADNPGELLGAWAGQGDAKYAVSIRQGLSERLGERLMYSKGCEIYSGQDLKDFRSSNGIPAATPMPDEDKTIAEAVQTAKDSDLAILALGESSYFEEGEAASRATLGFTGQQQRLLEAVVATGKPVVLLVVAGRPLELKWASEHVPAILETWSPGMEGGHAIADVLMGDVNPSAKLPVSLPRSVGQEPLYYAQLPTGRPAAGADLTRMPHTGTDKFLSRYMDEQNTALYPFGWGLSYTHFSYSKPTLSRTEIPQREAQAGGKPLVKVAFDLTNSGSRAGAEVAQLYVRNLGASVSQPLRQLKAFARVELAPGETRHIELPLGFDDLSFLNLEMKPAIEATTYKIFVGGSSLADGEAELKIVE